MYYTLHKTFKFSRDIQSSVRRDLENATVAFDDMLSVPIDLRSSNASCSNEPEQPLEVSNTLTTIPATSNSVTGGGEQQPCNDSAATVAVQSNIEQQSSTYSLQESAGPVQ